MEFTLHFRTPTASAMLARSAFGCAHALLFCGLLLFAIQRAHADESKALPRSEFAPKSLFFQAGTATGTKAVTLGLTWDLASHWKVNGGLVTTYVEASISGWSYNRQKHGETYSKEGRSELAQLAFVPVLRYRPDDGSSPWFLEAGLGVTVTSRVYATQSKRFSTTFNFGTHIGVGRSFGVHNEHEISLRVEHFSNAGIKHPNPGENFVQLRYAYRFL